MRSAVWYGWAMGIAAPVKPYEVPRMDDRDGSAPPPSEPPPARRATTASFPALEGDANVERATLLAEDARRRSRKIEATVGTLPTAVNPNGTGAFGVIFTSLANLTAKVDTIADGMATERAASVAREASRASETAAALALTERRRAPWSRAGWVILTAVLSCVTVGAVGTAGAYLALHWKSDVSASTQQADRGH